MEKCKGDFNNARKLDLVVCSTEKGNLLGQKFPQWLI
jgi:hypothetical protein